MRYIFYMLCSDEFDSGTNLNLKWCQSIQIVVNPYYIVITTQGNLLKMIVQISGYFKLHYKGGEVQQGMKINSLGPGDAYICGRERGQHWFR